MGQYSQAIQKLYVAYFNRAADPGGLAYWEDAVVRMNGDTSAVSNAFASSKEYQDSYANMSEAQVVNKVYQNLFGRAGEEAGVNFWANHLRLKDLTIDNVVTAVAGGAQGSDLTAYNSKVNAAAGFTQALNSTQKVQAYSGDNANAVARTYLSAVTDTASAAKAMATVDGAVNKLVAVANLQQNITLKPGNNTYNLTTPNPSLDKPIVIQHAQDNLALNLRPADNPFFQLKWAGSSSLVTVRESGALPEALQKAAASDYGMSWFYYHGDTYLMIRNQGGANNAYVEGKDWLFKIPGMFDLSHYLKLSVLPNVGNLQFDFNANDFPSLTPEDTTKIYGWNGRDSYWVPSADKLTSQLQVDGGDGYDYLDLTMSGSQNSYDFSGWQVKNMEKVSISGGRNITLDASQWQGLKLLSISNMSESHLTLGADTSLYANSQIENRFGSVEPLFEVNGGKDIEITTQGFQKLSVGAKTAPTGNVAVTHGWNAGSNNILEINGGSQIKAIMTAAYATQVKLEVKGNAQTQSVTASMALSEWAGSGGSVQPNAIMSITDTNFVGGKAGTIQSIYSQGIADIHIQNHGLRSLSASGDSVQIDLQNAKDASGSLQLQTSALQNFSFTDQGGLRKLHWENTGSNQPVNWQASLAKLEQLELGGTLQLNAADLKSLSKLSSLSLFDDAQINGSLNLSSLRLVNAYGNTGLSLVLNPGQTEFHGGKGDDTLRLAANSQFDKLQTIDGGAGKNTLILSSSQKTFLQNNKLLEKFVGFNNIVVDDSVQAQSMDSAVVLTGQHGLDGALLTIL